MSCEEPAAGPRARAEGPRPFSETTELRDRGGGRQGGVSARTRTAEPPPERPCTSRRGSVATEGPDRPLWVSAFPRAAPSAASRPASPGRPPGPSPGRPRPGRARAPPRRGRPVGRRARSPRRRPRGRAPNARLRPAAQTSRAAGGGRAGGREGPGVLGENAEAGRPLPRPSGRDERPHPGDPSPSVPRGLRRPRPLPSPRVMAVLPTRKAAPKSPEPPAQASRPQASRWKCSFLCLGPLLAPRRPGVCVCGRGRGRLAPRALGAERRGHVSELLLVRALSPH